MHLTGKPYSKQLVHRQQQPGWGGGGLHIWKIFLLVQSAAAGKGLPREQELTHGWCRRKLDEARGPRELWQELFDIVGAASSFAVVKAAHSISLA